MATAKQPIGAFVAFGVSMALLAVTVSMRTLGDFDLPWHLAYGRSIVAAHAFPHTDDFTVLAGPIYRVDVVADVFYYFIERTFGLVALQYFGGLVAVAIGCALVFAARASLRSLAAAPVVVGCLSPWLIVRPATMAFALTALFVGVLLRLLEPPADETPGPTRRKVFLVGLIAALWTNVHGSAALAVLIAFVFASYSFVCSTRIAERVPGFDVAHGSSWRSLAAALGATALGTLVSPYPLDIYRAPFRVTFLKDWVTEWTPTTWHLIVHEVPGIGAAALLTIVFAFRRGSTVRRSALSTVLVILAIVLGSRLRLLCFVIVMLFPIAFYTSRGRRNEPASSDGPRPVVVLLGYLFALFAAPIAMATDSSRIGRGFDPDHFPIRATAYVREHRPPGNIFNFVSFGGYLTWGLYPDYRTLIDGRIGMAHEEGQYREAVLADRDPVKFKALTTERNLDIAIVRAREGESFGHGVAASPDWVMVHWGEGAAVYLRAIPENRTRIEAGYRLLRHDTDPNAALRLALGNSPERAALDHDGRLARANDPASPRAIFFDVCGALVAMDLTRFDDATAALRERAPSHPALAVVAALRRERWKRDD